MSLKMYILVKDTVDQGHAVLAAAHASLGGYLHFYHDETPLSDDNPTTLGELLDIWVATSFRKVICKVTPEEFERAKTFDHYRVMTESALGDEEVAIVFAPREEWPKFFRYLKLYR